MGLLSSLSSESDPPPMRMSSMFPAMVNELLGLGSISWFGEVLDLDLDLVAS